MSSRGDRLGRFSYLRALPARLQPTRAGSIVRVERSRSYDAPRICVDRYSPLVPALPGFVAVNFAIARDGAGSVESGHPDDASSFPTAEAVIVVVIIVVMAGRIAGIVVRRSA